MTSVWDRIGAGFERWGRFVIRHRGAVIACILALSAGLGAQLSHLRVDNSVGVVPAAFDGHLTVE